MARREILTPLAAEAPALLRAVEEGLLALERGESAPEAAQSVFRSLHAAWAGAAVAGLENLERLAGRMELTLRLLVHGRLSPRQHIIDALLQAADLLAAMLTRLQEAEKVEAGGCLRALDAALGAELPPELIDRLTPAPLPGHPAWLVAPWLLERVLAQDQGLFMVILSKEAQDSGESLYAHLGELLTLGELLACAPGPRQSLELLYASPLEQDLLGEALSLPREFLRPLPPSDLNDSGEERPTLKEKPAHPGPAQAPSPQGFSTPVATASHFQAPASSPAPAVDLERRVNYLVFHLGGEMYGVEVSLVHEIINLPPVTPLPLSPEFVLGVVNLRGAVAPVFDLRLRLGLTPGGGRGEPVAVVVRLDGKLQGVVVDTVDDVLDLGSEDIQEPPEMAGPVRRECLLGLVQREEDLIILMDLARLLAQEPMDHAA
ncbi:MAG: chemotaxis protein CheW [Proteobacteria bacterium]|nr:chemotaxis protein CheW [Pseudomonadota bacterium]MBU1450964.1 chemotaxis protein CheW [Pseudomonadota bacterium]MBU2470443.1 chemotaxis protein CheW [Pseudomonadota bacterium]MBU2517439.1 chemotaxis protein CheW [Pseudomonadota bacterium]